MVFIPLHTSPVLLCCSFLSTSFLYSSLACFRLLFSSRCTSLRFSLSPSLFAAFFLFRSLLMSPVIQGLLFGKQRTVLAGTIMYHVCVLCGCVCVYVICLSICVCSVWVGVYSVCVVWWLCGVVFVCCCVWVCVCVCVISVCMCVLCVCVCV